MSDSGSSKQDDAKKQETDKFSSAQASDKFASAKANLRDTIKWLNTAFAAVAAAVLAGTSVAGLSELSGWHLWVSLGGGLLGLTCVFGAIGVTLGLLTSEAFFLGQLDTDEDLRERLERYSPDVVPPEFQSIREFLAMRKSAARLIYDSKAEPSREGYQSARNFYIASNPWQEQILNLAHFVVLRRNVDRSKWRLLVLSLGGLFGIGAFAVANGSKANRTEEQDARNGIVHSSAHRASIVAPVLVCREGGSLGSVLAITAEQEDIEVLLRSTTGCYEIRIQTLGGKPAVPPSSTVVKP
jgi:hypothetical protein